MRGGGLSALLAWCLLIARLAVAANVETHRDGQAGSLASADLSDWRAEIKNVITDRVEDESTQDGGVHSILDLRHPSLLMRRDRFDRKSRTATIIMLFAGVTGMVVVFLATQMAIAHWFMAREKKVAGKVQNPKAAYPWPSLPPPEEILEVGPTFCTNFKSGLQQAFTARNLTPADAKSTALVSYLNPAEAAGRTQPRALLERHNGVPPGCLGGKRAFALHLKRNQLEDFAPMTFLNPLQLRKALDPEKSCFTSDQHVPAEAAEGLWFLKHSTMERNEGVTCFKGADDLLAHWENKIPRDQRLRYVAQVEVPRPTLLEGRKMMIRAYVITLPAGRCFLNRELLLKGHPQSYDPSDPDPLRHVISCVKYDGVISARGTGWADYDEVWPKLCDMMAACLGPKAVGTCRTPYAPRDEGLFAAGWRHLSAWVQDLAVFLRWGRHPGALLYNLMGVDVIVDQDLRPWVIELNPGPAIGIDPRDQLATDLRAEVMEDLCALLLDPLLRCARAAKQAKHTRWAAAFRKVSLKPSTSGASAAKPRGFVQIA